MLTITKQPINGLGNQPTTCIASGSEKIEKFQHPNYFVPTKIGQLRPQGGNTITYIHSYMHTYIDTYIHACIYVCIHVYIHTYIQTYIHILPFI